MTLLPCIRDFYRSLASGTPFRNDLASVRDTVTLNMYDQGRAALDEAVKSGNGN